MNVKQHGGRRFSCGHYNLDADDTHRRRIVWVDGRNPSKTSIWERSGDEPPPSKPPSSQGSSRHDREESRADFEKPRAGGPNWYVRFTGRAPPKPDEVDGLKGDDAGPRRPASVWEGAVTPGAWTPPAPASNTELAPIASPGAVGIDSPSGQSVPEGNKWRLAVEDMYRRFNPEKLKDLDQIFDKYRGGEEQLYKALCEKYAPGWSPAGGPPLGSPLPGGPLLGGPPPSGLPGPPPGALPPAHWPPWQAHPHMYPPGPAPSHWHHPPAAPGWWPPPPHYMQPPPHHPMEMGPLGDGRSVSPPPGAWAPERPRQKAILSPAPAADMPATTSAAPGSENSDSYEEEEGTEQAQKRPRTDAP